MAHTLEPQIVQALLSLFLACVTGIIGSVTPKLHQWIKAHANAKVADLANTVLNGLGGITEAVVQDFNQRVVTQAKASGSWNADMAAKVKKDAVQAVLDQGASLVTLGKSAVGNVESLVGSMVEAAVAGHTTKQGGSGSTVVAGASSAQASSADSTVDAASFPDTPLTPLTES